MSESQDNTVPEYTNNILIDACGSIPSPMDIAKSMTQLPALPADVANTQNHIKIHQLGGLRSLYIPTPEQIRVALTIDQLLRQGYVTRNPTLPSTWRRIYADTQAAPTAPDSHILAASVIGIGGVGKSSCLNRALNRYPQSVLHPNFPGMAGSFKQLVWLKIDVPGSGRSVDFVHELMTALDNALDTHHFSHELSIARSSASQRLAKWRQVAMGHFLGLLVIDEIQNFFKLETKQVRSTSGHTQPVLRLVEDELLKFVLNLTNTWGIPVLVSGTPDAMSAFTTRFSTTQRLVAYGQHVLRPIKEESETYFKDYFFPSLCRYQWLEQHIEPTSEFRDLLFKLSGGIHRVILSLWFLAQRYALGINAKILEPQHFYFVMNNDLHPLLAPIAALKNDDPIQLVKYADLLPSGD